MALGYLAEYALPERLQPAMLGYCQFCISPSSGSGLHWIRLWVVNFKYERWHKQSVVGQSAHHDQQFSQLHVLLEKVIPVPATSVLVKRVLSSSGLLRRSHRARMTDQILAELVFLTCNKTVFVSSNGCPVCRLQTILETCIFRLL